MDSSSFDNDINNPFVFTDIEPIQANGATSDTYKVLIHRKWHFLKRPKKIYADNPLFLAAFQKEFEIGYTLDHPNIVRYISKGEDNESQYILTDYVDGFTLTDFIKVYPNYFNDKRNIDKLIMQLLSALGYLHERQILHLDLKPDNILITSINHDVKIVDFGFSYTDCFSSLAIGKTELYAAPEQLNKEEIDQRTDVYGFGKVLEYVLIHTCEGKPLSLYKTLVSKCLSVNKGDRFKSVNEIQNYLSIKPKSKNRIFVLFLISLIMLVVGVGVYQLYIRDNQEATIETNPLNHNDSLTTISDIIDNIDTVRQNIVSYNSLNNIPIKEEISISESANYSLMEREVKSYIDSIFNDLEIQYKDITLNNIEEASDEYLCLRESSNFGDSMLFKYRDISPNRIRTLFRKEMKERENTFKLRLSKFYKENKKEYEEYYWRKNNDN